MTALYTTILVVVGWVGAYFWRADRREAREARARAGVQEADILVNGGYHPARVVLKRGRPIRLRFTRTDDGESWWDDVEFPYARVLRELPEGEAVTVDVGPLEPGEYAFFSARGRMRGTLVIEDGIDGEHGGDVRHGDGHEARGGPAAISREDIRRRRALAKGGRSLKGGCH